MIECGEEDATAATEFGCAIYKGIFGNANTIFVEGMRNNNNASKRSGTLARIMNIAHGLPVGKVAKNYKCDFLSGWKKSNPPN